MGISVSGVTPAATMVQPPVTPARTPTGKGEAPLDFGPAVTFTPTSFDQAIVMQMYNGTGAPVALTQWLRNGTLPAPGAISPVEM